jgi:uncharacterized protein YndB with AHSA1/START domain
MSSKRNSSNEIRITRIYDAPVELVWDAWTDPEKVAQWWGPRGFTITHHRKELRPGGIWHYTMHGPDGTDYINKTLYHEVEECKKLVYDHGGNDERAPLFRVTALFRSIGDKTEINLSFALRTPEEAASMRQFIKAAGGNATWDRLAEFLDKTTLERDCFVINRSFDAPVEQVFSLWTDPDQLSLWLPPSGFEMRFIEKKILAGETAFYCMTNHSDMTLYGKMQYLEIQAPHRLVYIQQFCDEHGNQGYHPKLPVWPAKMLTTVQFTSEDADATRVTVHWMPHGQTNSQEIQAFLDLRPSMTQGWTGSFDKLETLLSSREVQPTPS